MVAAPVHVSKEAQRGAAIEILNRVDGEAADREAARLRSAGAYASCPFRAMLSCVFVYAAVTSLSSPPITSS